MTTQIAPGIVFDRDYVLTLNGRSERSGGTFPVYNPATKAVIAEVPGATRAQLDEAVDAAREAFKSWSRAPLGERQAVVRAIGERLEQHAEEFMALLTREQGKPRAGAEWEIYGSVAQLRAISTQSLEDEVVEDTPRRRVLTRCTPVGVVGAIAPWNFPVLLAVLTIAPALVTGNCVIVKPSPFTPLASLKLGEVVQDIVPADVLQVLSGDDDLGQWMSAHPGIDKIALTGDIDTGKHAMRSAATNLKRVTLELGGNDPAIVLPDVDPKEIAPKLFWASFQNSAQHCNATKRLYIHEDIYDDVRDALVAYASTVKVGDGSQPDTQLGPIQNKPQYEKVLEYFEDCAATGQRFALGGEVDRDAQGWFVPVTLVENPPDDSRLVREEPFGPILPLLKWRDEGGVIARANDTRYGLAASVWGRDLEAVQRIGRQLEAGTVWLNEIHEYSPYQPFGGHKESGVGCLGSLHGLAEYTNWQTITLNKA